MKYSDPSGYINQNPLPRHETVDKQGFGSGSSWMDNFGEPGYGGWGGTLGGGSLGGPGKGNNGTGLNGVYYDWDSGTMRTTNGGNVPVGSGYAGGVVSQFGITAKVFASSGGYSTFRGLHFTGGRTWYTEDGLDALNILIGGSASGQGGINWEGVTNATIGLVGGVAEMAIGGASTYFSAGTTTAISGPLMLDGGVRTVANAQRLGQYFNGKSKLADAYPTSLEALVGKCVDLAFGTSIYNVGFGQAIGGWGNDLTSFVVTGGNGMSLFELQKSPSFGTGLNYGYSLFSYPYSMYYNKPSK